jgi:hypothetical protein
LRNTGGSQRSTDDVALMCRRLSHFYGHENGSARAHILTVALSSPLSSPPAHTTRTLGMVT